MKSYDVAGATRTGLRATNADALLVDEAAGLFAVADGMRDTRASRMVAETALEAVHDAFLEEPWSSVPPTERSVDQASARLYLGVVRAHRRIYAPNVPRNERIGTTFAGIVACGSFLSVGHVGDSRIYLLRPHRGTLARLTDDHTVSARATQEGVSRDEAVKLPNANKLTRVLGVTRQVDLAWRTQLWEPGDIAMLCTDGVSDPLEEVTIAQVMLDTCDLSLDRAAQFLVDRATEGVGSDNATAILVRWVG